MKFDIEKIRKHYQENRKFLEEIVEDCLKKILNDARDIFIKDNPNVAKPKMPEIRTKDIAEIIEKANRVGNNWGYDQVYKIFDANGDKADVITIVNDLVAGRVVCATPNDVEKYSTILLGLSNRLFNAMAERKYVEESGYRALHIDCKIEVPSKNQKLYFPVEIQVKTLLQDAWANFGHDEFYKPQLKPSDLPLKISKYLADALDCFDWIGQEIRDEKLRKISPENISPRETRITKRTLNYLTRQIFSDSMNDIELSKCVDQLKAYGYDNIEDTSALARDIDIKNLIEVCKAEMKLLGETTPFEIFYFGPIAAKYGKEILTDEIRRYYGLTKYYCETCNKPIQEEEYRYIINKTDLDTIFYCEDCRKDRLKKCSECEMLTANETMCKICLSYKQNNVL